MRHGFIYLTAIIDWYSRYIVGWDLDDTPTIYSVIRAMERAKPYIHNSDQGSQVTSHDYIEFINRNNIRISMDGKGRWADNIPIERWFRSLKYEEVYLKEYENIRDARFQIGKFIDNYNDKRLHRAMNYETPRSKYFSKFNMVKDI